MAKLCEADRSHLALLEDALFNWLAVCLDVEMLTMRNGRFAQMSRC